MLLKHKDIPLPTLTRIRMKNLLRPAFHYFFKKKEFQEIWGGAFNGQEMRKQIFLDIVEKLQIESIVETGTFRGNTTRYMLEHSNSDIHTVEGNKEYFRYNQIQFFAQKRIHLNFGDSRTFLKTFFKKRSSTSLFCYLDAHWEQDLPLGEEVDIIFKNRKDAVVMIDDFLIPDDEGYTYDDYGPDKTLSLEYLNKAMPIPFHAFFPLSSENETGSRRGCVVITGSDQKAEILKTSKWLRTISLAEVR